MCLIFNRKISFFTNIKTIFGVQKKILEPFFLNIFILFTKVQD